MQQNEMKEWAEDYILNELIRMDIKYGKVLTVKKALKIAVMKVALHWVNTGYINNISDALKAVDEFRSQADYYHGQVEIARKHGDRSGWDKEYAKREEVFRWMANGLMDAVRKADSV